MSRWVALVALLAVVGCSRQTATPDSAAATAATPPAAQSADSTAAPPAPAATSQSETQQARASQETGNDAEHPGKGDSSLEKMSALPATAQLPAGKWQPGVNYTPLVPSQPTSVAPGKVEVLEVFWLGCPHCYALEPYLRAWLKTKPAYVELVRVPVIWGPMHKAHARLFFTLESLGRQDLVSKAFDTIQQQHQPLIGNSEEESLRAGQEFAAANGVSAADFAKAYNSFSVNSDMQRAEELTQRYHVEGVPLVVVNGKYTTDVAKAGDPQKLIELINDLAASEHRG